MGLMRDGFLFTAARLREPFILADPHRALMLFLLMIVLSLAWVRVLHYME